MVKVAVAGGTGNVATELLRSAIASGKHEITILTRAVPEKRIEGVEYEVVDYHSLHSLITALTGIHTCLSFLIASQDPSSTIQKNLIHACISASVTRFAPSEWSIKNNNGCPPYANKDAIADYLAELKANDQLGGLQYCLFQPSIFMEYFAHGGKRRNMGLHTWTFFVDFEHRRAIVLDGGDQPIVLTAIGDVSAMLDLALSDERAWPAIGGMRGARTSVNELVALGKKIRGGEWSIEYVKGEDAERDVLATSWVPLMTHPVIPEEKREVFSKDFVTMFFKAMRRGAWETSAEWNERFPEYGFTGLEEYLREAWEGVE